MLQGPPLMNIQLLDLYSLFLIHHLVAFLNFSPQIQASYLLISPPPVRHNSSAQILPATSSAGLNLPQASFQASHVPRLSAPVLQSTVPQPLGISAVVPYQPVSSAYLPSSIQPAIVAAPSLVTYAPVSNIPQHPSLQPLTVPSQRSYASTSQFHQHQVFPAIAPLFATSAPYRPHERFIEGPSFPHLTREDETQCMMLKMILSNLLDPRETEQYK